MNSNKIPIWERQGRPKPPLLGGFDSDDYSRQYDRWRVIAYDRECFPGDWMILSPRELDEGEEESPDFSNFTEAIFYADKESRSRVCN